MGAPPPRHGGREVSRYAAPRGRTAGAGPPSHHGGAPRLARRGEQSRVGACRDWGRGWEGEGAPLSRPAWARVKQRAARPRRGEAAGHIGGIAGQGELRGAPTDTRRGAEEGHEGTRVVRGGRAGGAGAALPLPSRADAEAAPRTRPRPCAHLCCAGSRGHRGGRPARAHLTSKRGPILFFSR